MWWMTGAAWACAGLVHGSIDTAESGGSEVAFEIGGGQVTATWLTRYQGSATDFGWIIPVGGPFVSLEDGDADFLAALREVTEPGIEYPESSSGGGCGGASKGDVAGGTPNGVEVIAEGYTGTYEYTVIEASDGAGLNAWLDDHGWSAAAIAADLDSYAAAGMPLALLRILPEHAATSETQLPPVKITWQATEALYPLKMARSGTQPEQRLTIWVVGDGLASMTGATVDTASEVPVPDGDPNEMFEDHLAAVGWARVAATETFDERRVTRFDALLASADADFDPVFTIDPADQSSASLTFVVEEGAEAWLLLPIGLAGWLSRRRARSAL
jgi:hypothetical protein